MTTAIKGRAPGKPDRRAGDRRTAEQRRDDKLKTRLATQTRDRVPTGVIYAIKKGKGAAAFMPDEVIVSLDGEPKGRLLTVCGWSMTTSAKDKACKKWPLARLKHNLDRIEEEWVEEIGKGWKLEIRAL
jgi:hypothetical protein